MEAASVAYPKLTTFSELTIDGRLTLTPRGSSKALFAYYGAPLQQWFHAQRAAHDAIMVGAGTVRADLRTQGLSAGDLHWLGLRAVAKTMSMSALKSRAILQSGFTSGQQIGFDPHRIVPAAQVEIQVKIASDYDAAP